MSKQRLLETQQVFRDTGMESRCHRPLKYTQHFLSNLLLPLSLTMSVKENYYSRFTDEETKALERSDFMLEEVIQRV